MAAGDSVGATPPISTFFERQADDRDHEHDRDRHRRARQPQLRPRRGLPADAADPAGELPVRLGERRRRERQHAEGVVAVARVQVPGRRARSASSASRTTTSRRSRSPARSTRSTSRTRLDAINAEAARLAKRVDAVVAIGHLGATGGTLTAPTGPLIELADDVANVDAVIGDHTDQQVLTTRPNGVLVTENRSKGIRSPGSGS